VVNTDAVFRELVVRDRAENADSSALHGVEVLAAEADIYGAIRFRGSASGVTWSGRDS